LDEAAKNPAKGLRSPAVRSLLLGGILPVLAFALVEELWGATAGLIAGMAFGVGEILWEWRTQKKVSAITWVGNGLLLVLGGVSIVSDEGYWFKLQPALLEGAMTLALFGSALLGKPLLAAMAQKQLPLAGMPEAARAQLERRLKGMNLRMGVFFAVHTVLAVWSALYWSTAAWAMLKGVGFTASMIAYVLAEVLWVRIRNRG
jgi:intracellular septation protein